MTWKQSGGTCPTNISIDRIDSSVGYEECNVQLVCHVVNTMKMHYETEDLIWWSKQIVDNNQ